MERRGRERDRRWERAREGPPALERVPLDWLSPAAVPPSLPPSRPDRASLTQRGQRWPSNPSGRRATQARGDPPRRPTWRTPRGRTPRASRRRTGGRRHRQHRRSRAWPWRGGGGRGPRGPRVSNGGWESEGGGGRETQRGSEMSGRARGGTEEGEGGASERESRRARQGDAAPTPPAVDREMKTDGGGRGGGEASLRG